MGRERRDEGREMVRKGPWKAEEDEILIHHVNKYGPRDWSSIRSKGLLLRTGKSCRLRWVNKLRPNLKSGVKFSAEEERVVIELQAQFGNKWARIARYLPGRTDNDVKNFWSSRQKRLARILQTTPTTPPPRSHRYTKTPTFHPLSTLEAAPNSLGSSTVKAESSSNIHTCSSSSSCSHVQTPDPIRMVPLPDLINPNSLDLDTQVDFNPTENDPNPSFEQPQLEAPILEFPHSQVLEDANFLEAFEGRDGCELGNVGRFSLGLPLPPFPSLAPQGCSGNKCGGKIDTPDSFFDDFPADMFDHIDPLPSLTDW